MKNKFYIFLTIFYCLFACNQASADTRNMFLHAGFGYGTYSVKFKDEGLSGVQSKVMNFNFGFGYKLQKREFFTELYAGFLGNLNQNDATRKKEDIDIKFNGNNNAFLGMLNFGKKYARFEPFLIGGLAFSALSYQASSIQKNYLNLGVIYGIGFNIPSNENKNTVFTFKLIGIQGFKRKDCYELKSTQVNHLFLNIGANYYFN